MSKSLCISRSRFYYNPAIITTDSELENSLIEIFNNSHKNYGTRKIKEMLNKPVSRRKIGLIMAKYSLVSKYTLKRYKNHKSAVNEAMIPNAVNREFNCRALSEVAVSDLTYVRVGNAWNYICTIIDLHNREIIGFSVGKSKDSELVRRAFYVISSQLRQLSIVLT